MRERAKKLKAEMVLEHIVDLKFLGTKCCSALVRITDMATFLATKHTIKLISLLIIMLCGSCAVPQIIILKDPLTAEEHINLGYLYEKQGKLDLAEEEYKKAIRKDKKNYLAYFNLGNIYAQRGEYEKAERQYRKALKLKEDPDVLNNLAYVLNKQGKKEEALLYIKKALEMKDDPFYRKTLEEILKKE